MIAHRASGGTFLRPLSAMPRMAGHQKAAFRPLATSSASLPPSGRLRAYLVRLSAESCACESCERLLEVLR